MRNITLPLAAIALSASLAACGDAKPVDATDTQPMSTDLATESATPAVTGDLGTPPAATTPADESTDMMDGTATEPMGSPPAGTMTPTTGAPMPDGTVDSTLPNSTDTPPTAPPPGA